eukprot:GHVP01040807.1.p1 GENE.GHVP01040807.1~~GHVP01040807.1.p1  ORF type:complete len:132 (+),score=30.22 GHVP01040807.1:25-396(+)
MEVKILLDQLNSACEDLDLPQAGFPIQDDLHQGFFEPEFRGFTVNDGKHVSWKEFESDAGSRYDHFASQIKKYVLAPGEYDVTNLNDFKAALSLLGDGEAEIRVNRSRGAMAVAANAPSSRLL